ncbi:MAG: hypothetical protein ACPLXS_02865 [Candidatus Micrarchaeales archaeon]
MRAWKEEDKWIVESECNNEIVRREYPNFEEDSVNINKSLKELVKEGMKEIDEFWNRAKKMTSKEGLM